MSTLSSSQVTEGGFEMIPKSESPTSLPAERATTPSRTTSSKKIAKDITWSNVNYNVGAKKILTDCWGKVGKF
jgi:hypothetical protein